MNILITNHSSQPIYEQIRSQIQQEIMNGTLKEGDALPSIRLLAKELKISVITTKRAYEELERDGFIATVPGKGCFVAPQNLDFIRETQIKEVEQHLQNGITLAKQIGMKKNELQNILELLFEEE